MKERKFILEVRNLEKTYVKNGKRIYAVNDISFYAAPGEAVGIIGESGSGKSTLLRQIACLEKADKGGILLEGRDITGERTETICGSMQMIFQDAVRSFNPRMILKTAIDDVLRQIGGMSGAALDERREALIRMVGLTPEQAEKYPGQISGGQCQRMAIARALAAEPKILLCDEITSALDVSVQAQVMRLLKSLKQELALTILFVTHDLALAAGFCDRLLVMKDGVCVEQGISEEIVRDPKESYTRSLLQAILPLP